MSADWLDGDPSPVARGGAIAIATLIAAIALGTTMYQLLDDRTCRGFYGLQLNSYEYTKKVEQCMADGKSVPGK